MEETIIRILQLLKQEFKFFDITDERVASWIEFLGDIEPDNLYRATVAYISEGGDKVPTWGMIRKKALLLENAHLSVSPSMAWGRVLLKIKSKEFKLTDLETRALACTCDLYNLRTMKASDLSYERNFFIKHYEELRNKEIQKVITVKQDFNLLESNNGQAKRLES
jgi:hypothetical protein